MPSSLSYMQLNKCSVEFIPYVRTRCPVQSSEDTEPKTPKRKQPVTVIVSLSSSLINSSIKNTNNCQCENASCCAHRHFSLVEEAITKKNNKKKRRHSQIIERLTDTVTTERSTGPPSHVVNRCSFHGDLVSPLSGRHGYYSSERAPWLVESRMELGCCARGWVGGRLREQNRFDMRFQSHGWVAEPDADSPPVSLSLSLTQTHRLTHTSSHPLSQSVR